MGKIFILFFCSKSRFIGTPFNMCPGIKRSWLFFLSLQDFLSFTLLSHKKTMLPKSISTWLKPLLFNTFLSFEEYFTSKFSPSKFSFIMIHYDISKVRYIFWCTILKHRSPCSFYFVLVHAYIWWMEDDHILITCFLLQVMIIPYSPTTW